jgi:hypothetical protein
MPHRSDSQVSNQALSACDAALSVSRGNSAEVESNKKKLFLKNKIIQADALAAVEAKERSVTDQAHVPDNSN